MTQRLTRNEAELNAWLVRFSLMCTWQDIVTTNPASVKDCTTCNACDIARKPRKCVKKCGYQSQTLACLFRLSFRYFGQLAVTDQNLTMCAWSEMQTRRSARNHMLQELPGALARQKHDANMSHVKMLPIETGCIRVSVFLVFRLHFFGEHRYQIHSVFFVLTVKHHLLIETLLTELSLNKIPI